jgi:hypothetical protein
LLLFVDASHLHESLVSAMNLMDLVAASERVAATAGRNDKANQLADVLRRIDRSDRRLDAYTACSHLAVASDEQQRHRNQFLPAPGIFSDGKNRTLSKRSGTA